MRLRGVVGVALPRAVKVVGGNAPVVKVGALFRVAHVALLAIRSSQTVEVIVGVGAGVWSSECPYSRSRIISLGDIAYAIVVVGDVLHQRIGRGAPLQVAKTTAERIVRIVLRGAIAEIDRCAVAKLVVADAVDKALIVAVLGRGHAFEIASKVVGIAHPLLVGIGDGQRASPGVVFGVHDESVGIVLCRKHKGTTIFRNIAHGVVRISGVARFVLHFHHVSSAMSIMY